MSKSVHPDSPTHTHSPPGVAALLDRYEVLGVIGQGGMGTVYKGYHLSLKRFVAIKVLRIDRIKDPDQVSRFLREMQAIGQMDHPNVVRAADAGEKNGLFYLVMEYLEGQDLSRLVAEQGRLGPADACELARQAAVGLEYIHQTLVHRDVKPSNLILAPSGLVKVLDLGLARLHEADLADKERTPEGCALGTFDYMAPEQAAGGGRIDGRTDIYSLGCTLFKLLTGRAPFTGPDYNSVARKLYAHGHVPLTALAEFQTVPEEVRPVLLGMTAKNPDERYPTAGKAAQALAPLAAGSQPATLLGGPEGAGKSTVDPLPVPLPEELSRLTGRHTETRANSPAASTLPAPGRPFAWRRASIGAGVLACALAAAAWFLVPGLTRWWGDVPPASPPARPEPMPSSQGPAGQAAIAGPRDLDKLEVRTHHLLLDQSPFPAWTEEGVPPTWRWVEGLQRVEVYGPGTLLLALGTTSRPNFTFETGLDQAPWTGNVGVFWGYHEDADAKAAHTPDREFARFQVLCVGHTFDPARGNRYWVQRLQCGLRYNVRGEVRDRTSDFLDRHDVLSPAGETILQITVAHDQLQSAQFGGVPLTKLCSDSANDHFKSEPSRGALGLVTFSTDVRFSNARFLAQPGQ